METFCPGDRTRKVFGFDHFEGLSAFTDKDGRLDDQVGKVEGGYSSSLADIEELVRIHNDDNYLSGIERCRIVNGDVQNTLPKFLDEHPGLKIALLHLDLDTYKPTRFALEHLYDRVLRGGVIVLDEYALVPWQGETQALDEFLEKRKLKPVIKKFDFAPQPHAYFIKD